MSGGSYNYLYARIELPRDDLSAMADRLDGLGVSDAAAHTRALIQTPGQALRLLWQAVELRDSNDIGDDALRDALAEWRDR